MKVTIATCYDDEGYALVDYDTDEMTQHQKKYIAEKLVDVGEDCIPIIELEKNAKTLGKEIFSIMEEYKNKDSK